MLDAAALLWRLRLDGVDVADRFDVIADAWANAIDSSPSWYVFNDVHAVMAFLGAGRRDDAVAVIERLTADADRATTTTPASNARMTADVGLPVSRCAAGVRRRPSRRHHRRAVADPARVPPLRRIPRPARRPRTHTARSRRSQQPNDPRPTTHRRAARGPAHRTLRSRPTAPTGGDLTAQRSKYEPSLDSCGEAPRQSPHIGSRVGPPAPRWPTRAGLGSALSPIESQSRHTAERVTTPRPTWRTPMDPDHILLVHRQRTREAAARADHAPPSANRPPRQPTTRRAARSPHPCHSTSGRQDMGNRDMRCSGRRASGAWWP